MTTTPCCAAPRPFVERNVRDLIVIVSPGGARAHAEGAAELVPRLRAIG